MINPLLSDLQDEITETLIREGNLKREKAKPAFIAQWTHQGYVARLHYKYCSCGGGECDLVGIFSREVSPTGQVRDTALNRGFQAPLGHNYPIEETSEKTAVCPSCVTSKGFSYESKS